jgi:hypothetical protein
MNKHNSNNELYIQVEDVIQTYGELAQSLKIALHDREQLVKEYGKQVATTFENIQKALSNADMTKVYVY